MQTLLMFSRIAPEVLRTPQSFEQLERSAMERVRKDCPEIVWRHNYAIAGPWDYLDIFDAPDIEAATKVSALIRAYGHTHTEIWSAIEWQRFKEIVHGLPGGKT